MTNYKRKRDKLNMEEDESFFWIGTLRGFGPLLILGVSTISFWGSIWIFTRGQTLIVQTILKFVIYLSMILWLNSAFYMREKELGTDVDTREFQNKQVKFTLWIFTVFILMELPTWLFVFSAP